MRLGLLLCAFGLHRWAPYADDSGDYCTRRCEASRGFTDRPEWRGASDSAAQAHVEAIDRRGRQQAAARDQARRMQNQPPFPLGYEDWSPDPLAGSFDVAQLRQDWQPGDNLDPPKRPGQSRPGPL